MMHELGTTPLRLAVAEDDADLRNAFVGMLQLLGHTVVCAAGDGAELLDACSRLEVDLVVVDLDMPIVDGLQAAETLAEQGIPVVLISGHPDVQDVVLEHEPVVARIVKPATLDRFRKAIADAVSARHG